MDSVSSLASLTVHLLLASLCLPVTESQTKDGDVKRSDILNHIVRLATHTFDDLKTTPPLYNNREPAKIHVLLYVSSIDQVNEASMDFTVGILLHLRWEDKRIYHVKAAQYFDASKLGSLDFDSENIKKVWVPDIFFPNEKKGSFHVIMTQNQMMRLYKGGTMLYISRLSPENLSSVHVLRSTGEDPEILKDKGLTVTLSCPMDLINYPFDKQTCHLLIMSFGYSDNDIILEWTNATEPIGELDPNAKPILLDELVVLPQFEVKQVVANTCNKRYHQKMGNHSCLQAEFHMARNVWFYMVQMYVPSILIVMLSWISFWLTVNSVPARIFIGLLTVLTTTTQSSSVNAALPRVSYTKAIDVWMSSCLVFVFAALLEFAIVNVLSRKASIRGFSLKQVFTISKDYEAGEASPAAEVTLPIDGFSDGDGQKRKWFSKPGIVYAMYLDVCARILFPACFILFIVTYWSYYVNTN